MIGRAGEGGEKQGEAAGKRDWGAEPGEERTSQTAGADGQRGRSESMLRRIPGRPNARGWTGVRLDRVRWRKASENGLQAGGEERSVCRKKIHEDKTGGRRSQAGVIARVELRGP